VASQKQISTVNHKRRVKQLVKKNSEPFRVLKYSIAKTNQQQTEGMASSYYLVIVPHKGKNKSPAEEKK
jgi:hypothetical protein